MADQTSVSFPVEGIPAADFWIDTTFEYQYWEDPIRVTASELYIKPGTSSGVIADDVPKFIESPNLIYNTACNLIHLAPVKVIDDIDISDTADINSFHCKVIDSGLYSSETIILPLIKDNQVSATINNVPTPQTVWQVQEHAGAYNFLQMINTGNAIMIGSLPQVIVRNKVVEDTSKEDSLNGGVFVNTKLFINKGVEKADSGNVSRDADTNYPEYIYLPQSFIVSSHLFSSPPDIEQELANKNNSIASTYILLNMMIQEDRKVQFLVEMDVRGNMTLFLKEGEYADKIPEYFATEVGRADNGVANQKGYKKLGAVQLPSQSNPISGKEFTDLVFFFTPFGLGIYQGTPQSTSWGAEWSYDFVLPIDDSKGTRKNYSLFSARIQSMLLGVKFASASFAMSDIIFADEGTLKFGPVGMSSPDKTKNNMSFYDYTMSSTQDGRSNFVLSIDDPSVINKDYSSAIHLGLLGETIIEDRNYYLNLKMTATKIQNVAWFSSFFNKMEWVKNYTPISPFVPEIIKSITETNPISPISLSGEENVTGRSYNLTFFVPPKNISSAANTLRTQLQHIQGAYPCVLKFGYKKRQSPDGNESNDDLGYADNKPYGWIDAETKTVKGFIWSSPKWSRTGKETTLSFTMVDRSEMLKNQWKACLPIYDGWRGRDVVKDLCQRGGFKPEDVDTSKVSGGDTNWSDQLSFGSLQGPEWMFPTSDSLWSGIEKVAQYWGWWIYVGDDSKIYVVDSDVKFGLVDESTDGLDETSLLVASYEVAKDDPSHADYVENTTVFADNKDIIDPKKIIWSISRENSFEKVYNQVLIVGVTPASYYVGMELKNPALRVLSESVPDSPENLQKFIHGGTYELPSSGGGTAVNLIPFPKILMKTDPKLNSPVKVKDMAERMFYRNSTRYEGMSFSCRGYTDRKPLDVIIVAVASEPRIFTDTLTTETISVDTFIVSSISYNMNGSDKTFTRSISCDKVDLNNLHFLRNSFDYIAPTNEF